MSHRTLICTVIAMLVLQFGAFTLCLAQSTDVEPEGVAAAHSFLVAGERRNSFQMTSTATCRAAMFTSSNLPIGFPTKGHSNDFVAPLIAFKQRS